MNTLIALGGFVLLVWVITLMGRRFSVSGIDMFIRAIVVAGALGLVIYAVAVVFRFWPAALALAVVAAAILLVQGVASRLRR